jgi:hypothetical protein
MKYNNVAVGIILPMRIPSMNDSIGERKNMKIKILALFSATILTVLTMATIGAYASPSADLDQCRNGPADAPVNCTGDAWVNGNVGAQQGHLAEGYSIPYRTRMFELPPNTQVSLVLGYDIKHSDANAIDYLTYFERLDSPPGSHLLTFGHPPEIVDPTSGVTFTGPTTTFPIPAPSSAGTPIDDQPNASFNNLTPAEKIMTLFGGTITDIKYVTQGDLTASTSETRVMVNFTTNSTCPLVKVGSKFVQQCTAVLSWGGHIASSNDWGAGNSAGGISGSPYHMRLISWNLGNLGNQDRSLAAAAVTIAPSTITIIKNTIPDDEQLFDYTTVGTGLSPFSLKDNGTSSNSTTFGGLAAGTYTVQEGTVTGFNLTALSCTDPSGDTTTSLNTRTANIVLAAGETVTCTFENTKNATLTIIKDAIPDDEQLFDYTTVGTGLSPFSLKDNGTSSNSTTFSLEPGAYSVTEIVPANWNLTNVLITDPSGGSSRSGTTANIDLAAGDTVTVKFENTKNATLTIIKDAIPDDEHVFSFTGDGGIGGFALKDNGTLPNSTTFGLEPGTYNVSETVPAGWVLTTSCSDGSPVNAIELSDGESVTCTFTNAKLHLKFIKEGSLDFAGQTTDYTINVTNNGFANLTIVNMTNTDPTGILICDTAFPRLLAVGDTTSCSVLFATDSDINATTIIEILAQPANIFWRV